LPFLFASGAALSAGAAAAMTTPPAYAEPARRLALAGAALELGLTQLMQAQLGEHGEPYTRSSSAKLGHVSEGCIVGGAALLALRGGRSRAAAVAAGTLMLAGALAARWSVFKAGLQSASDPKYVVDPQRAAIRRGERRGAARREATVATGTPAVGSPATSPDMKRDQEVAASDRRLGSAAGGD
jgi:hypothetical protein